MEVVSLLKEPMFEKDLPNLVNILNKPCGLDTIGFLIASGIE
jgi:hypothetical protein